MLKKKIVFPSKIQVDDSLPLDALEVGNDEQMDLYDFVPTQRHHIVTGERLSPHGVGLGMVELLVA